MAAEAFSTAIQTDDKNVCKKLLGKQFAHMLYPTGLFWVLRVCNCTLAYIRFTV